MSDQDWREWRNDVDAVLRELVARQPEEKHIGAMKRWSIGKAGNLLTGNPDKWTGMGTPICVEVSRPALNTPHKYSEEIKPGRALAELGRKELSSRLAEVLKQLDDEREKSLSLQQNWERRFQALLAEKDEIRANVTCDLVPFQIEKYLEQLSPELRQLVEKYYDTAKVHIFLVQCGQFNRIGQFWEACKRRVLDTGAAPHDMPDFLRRMLELYNEATPQGEASAVVPAPGSIFDYDAQQRLGKDGVTVRKVILPGLKNPAGKVLHKALVILAG